MALNNDAMHKASRVARTILLSVSMVSLFAYMPSRVLIVALLTVLLYFVLKKALDVLGVD